MTQIIAFIPARRNSKGIKFKNRQVVGKYNLVQHACNFAKALPFDKIILSTDDEFFIEDQNLSEYISIRPPELATDDSIISDVIIEWDIARKENDTFYVLLEPTCVFRELNDLKFLFNGDFFKTDYRSFASFKSVSWDYSKIWHEEKKIISPISNPWKRRQESKLSYVLTGHYYGFYGNTLKEIYPSILNQPCMKVEIENERCIDINDKYDLMLAREKIKDE
jgi:CMP-N-acetylneuraminic acid synthetase